MTTRHSALRPQPSLRTRAACALLSVAASLLGGCYDPEDPTQVRRPDRVFVVPSTDLSATLRDANDDFVSEIDAVHMVGGTACPQTLGTLTVSNEGDTPAQASLDVLADGNVAIDVLPSSVEVPAGGEAEIVVEFNCMATDDIDAALELSIEVGGRISVFDIPLVLDVEF